MNPVIIGDATLYLGDCREILPTLPKVDAVITDPPYGIGELWDAPQMGKNGASVFWDGSNSWDHSTSPERLNAALAITKKAIVWGGNYYALPPSRGALVWDKMQTFSNADFEYAWCSWPQTPRIFRYARAQLAHHEVKQHPTQKPLPLMKWCLSFLGDAKTILDPFMGSGTTGVAAMQLGRKFIGIEIEPKYFDIACERIENAQRQQSLFEPVKKPEQLGLMA